MSWRRCEINVIILTLQQSCEYNIYSILSAVHAIQFWGNVWVTLQFRRYCKSVTKTLSIGCTALPQCCHNVVSFLDITCSNFLTPNFSPIQMCNSTFPWFISTASCCLTLFISNIWRFFLSVSRLYQCVSKFFL